MTDIDAATLDDLREIRRLLTEMYQHWETHSDDPHCKSSEGAISLDFPPFFWHDEQAQRPSVSIYSYVMGPHRSHHFEDSSAALREVRRWHQREMNHNYEEEWL